MRTQSAGTIGQLVSTLALVLMALTSVAACAQAPNGGNTTHTQPPITIGASVPLTGDFSDDGKALQQGYQIWAEEINQQGGLLGRPVVLDLLNDNSDAKQVTTNYQKLITVDKVDLIVGPLSSTMTIAAMRVAKRYNYAFVEGIGSANSVFDAAKSINMTSLFSVSLSVASYMNSFSYYILSLPQAMRPKTVAYVGADDPFVSQQLTTLKTSFSKYGLRTVLDATYSAEATDFAAFAQKIVASQADVVVLGSQAVTDCSAFINSFKQQKYDPKAFIATTGPDQGTAFTSAIGGARYAQGVFIPNGSWSPGVQSFQNAQFVSDYLAKFGGKSADISATAAEGYSVLQVLGQAVNHIHSIDNTKLIAELQSGTYSSVQGPVRFDSNGENTLSVPFLFQWQNGQLIVVYPGYDAKANPEYPKAQVW